MAAPLKEHRAKNCNLLVSLRPKGGLRLNEEDLRFLSDLESFEAPFLKGILLAKSIFPSEADYEDTFAEFKKFVALVRLHGGSFPMLSREVDDLWHQFILFTRQYTDFCLYFIGRYLHHDPGSGGVAEPAYDDRFFKLYRLTFGDVPTIWRATSDCSSCGSDSGDNCWGGGGD